jgi:crossover junction endodeoxyribonuclease RuvC
VIVLGIDPGTASLGYGIVDRIGGRLRAVDHGCFTTGPDTPLPDRLLAIQDCLTELLELHKPSVMAVERLFFSRNVQTAFAVGQARGVVLAASARAGVPVREATPSEVKVAVSGDGRADKEQVGRLVQLVLGLERVPTPDDAADALAVAIWAANVAPGVEARRSAVVDRAAVAPITRGRSAYDRAVADAVARERGERRSAS